MVHNLGNIGVHKRVQVVVGELEGVKPDSKMGYIVEHSLQSMQGHMEKGFLVALEGEEGASLVVEGALNYSTENCSVVGHT